MLNKLQPTASGKGKDMISRVVTYIIENVHFSTKKNDKCKKMRKYGRLHINDSSIRMYMPTAVIPPTESLSYSERPQPD